MAEVCEFVDEALYIVLARRASSIVVHYVHERYDYGAGVAELGFADNADIFLVRAVRFVLIGAVH